MNTGPGAGPARPSLSCQTFAWTLESGSTAAAHIQGFLFWGKVPSGSQVSGSPRGHILRPEPSGAPGRVFDLKCRSCGCVRRCTRTCPRKLELVCEADFWCTGESLDLRMGADEMFPRPACRGGGPLRPPSGSPAESAKF